MTTTIKNSIFWDITPCNPLKVKQRFGETCRFHFQARRVSRLRATCFHTGFLGGSIFDPKDSCEMSDDFQRTTRRYIPEVGTENLKFNHCDHVHIN
jgi:hypothetical protein